MTREDLGRLVRETWVQWASEQPDPKPSWLVPWDGLDGGQREVDMRIGEAVADAQREHDAQLAERHSAVCARLPEQALRAVTTGSVQVWHDPPDVIPFAVLLRQGHGAGGDTP